MTGTASRTPATPELRAKRGVQLNSLPIKLLLVFVLVLGGTVGAAFIVGLQAAQKVVESEIVRRLEELSVVVVDKLRHAGTDENGIREALAAALRTNKSVYRVELFRSAALGVDADINVARTEPDGIYLGSHRGPVRWRARGSETTEIEDHR